MIITAIRKYLTPYYVFSVYKVTTGLLEITLGSLLITFPSNVFHDVVIRLTREELIEDPQDIVVAIVLHYLPLLAKIRPIGVVALAVGLYDAISGFGLFLKKAWAYTVILTLSIASVPYEVYIVMQAPQLYTFISLVLTLLFIFILLRFKPPRSDGEPQAKGHDG